MRDGRSSEVPVRPTAGGRERPAAPTRSPLGPAERALLALQRTSGNRAVSGLVQRLAYTDSPSAWGPVTITRSPEGEAGVYFIASGGDQIVLKPVEAAAPAEYASTFMQQGMGLGAPLSKVYAKDSAEGRQITALLTGTRVQGSRSATELADQIGKAEHYHVMSKVGGKSIKTLDDTEATQFIQDDGALEAVGRIMVADAFLGNTDRLLWSINLGNFFYAAAGAMATDVVRTIDNESNFVALQYNQRGDLDLNSAMRLSFIDNLLDRAKRAGYIKAFIAKFREVHEAQQHVTAVNALDAEFARVYGAVSQGVELALDDVAQVFKTNIELVRAVAVPQEQESRARRDPDTAKGLAHYIRARRRDRVTKAEAVDQLKSYLEYRASRNRTEPGLKWVTKLFGKRGFSFA